MNLSLRNLAVAGAMVLATSAFAQDDAPFNVTANWFKTYTGNTINEYRFGTGWDGKVYAPNKTTGVISVFDGTDVITTLDPKGAIAVNLTHDDAGNFLFHRSWASAGTDCTKWSIYNHETGEVTDLEITLPEDAVAARMDLIGRVIGDVLSEEGGVMIFTPNTADKCYLVKIANGQQVELGFSDYPLTDKSFSDVFDTTTLGQFFLSYEEVSDMGDDWINAVALRKRGATGNAPYIYSADINDGAGGWTYVTVPGAKSSEGFDVFMLDDVLYAVTPAGDVNYTSRFAIINMDNGKVVYTSPAEHEVSKAAGQGFGSITANKVSDSKVEIYIVGQTANATGITYTGMYTVEVPQAVVTPDPLYIVGDAFGWTPESPAEFAYEDGKYTISADNASGGFKISTAKGTAKDDWNTYNAGVYGLSEDNVPYTLALDKAETLQAGKLGNINFPGAGNYTITVDPADWSILLTGETFEVKAPEKLYVRGEGSNWGISDDWALALTEERGLANEYVYEGTFTELAGQFKICDDNEAWQGDVNYGRRYDDGLAVEGGKTYDAWFNCDPFSTAEALKNVTVKFYWNPDHNAPSYISFEVAEIPVIEPQDRAYFAYGLDLVKGENNNYTIKFNATGDAPSAVLVLTNKDDDSDVIYATLGAVKKGENTFTYNASDLADGKTYNWAIELHNNEIAETVITTLKELNVSSRMGVGSFIDPQYESYGYTVVSLPNNTGIEIYSPEGELLKTVNANAPLFGGAGKTNPMKVAPRGNEAVFASYNDAAWGVVAMDIFNTDDMYSVFEGEKDNNGLITLNGVGIGSGTPSVGFFGKGADTKMITFDEDLLANKIAVYNIGEAKTIATAPEDWGMGSQLANHNVDFATYKDGVFVAQVRGAGQVLGSVPGLAYISGEKKDIIWDINDVPEADSDPDFLPTTLSGVAINQAGDLLAVATRIGVEFFIVGWENDAPTIEKYASVKVFDTEAATARVTRLSFDAGNNLHLVNASKGYFLIAVADKEPVATTAAKTESTIANTSGVENIALEAAHDGVATYYNLNGVKVAADNLTPGVYVKVANGKAAKVIVK